MSIKWNGSKKEAPSILFKKIRQNQCLMDDGRCSYEGMIVNELTPVIISFLKFPSVAKHIDKSDLVFRSLMSNIPDIDEHKFIQKINDLLGKELSKKEIEYCLLFTISLDIVDLFKSLKINGCQLYFYKDAFPRKFRKHREEDIKRFEAKLSPPQDIYTPVVGTVRARSEEKAFHDVMHAIDLFRSFACLIGNSHMQISLGGRSKDPVNVIRLGMMHTLHTASGEIYNQNYGWFETNYSQGKKYKFKDPGSAKRRINLSFRKLEKLKYAKKVENSLVRYVRALDEQNYNTAFIGMWGALECLLTPEIADYDKLIRRCTFLFKDAEYYGVLLEHLRVYRNKTIHAGELSDDSKILCYQLQQCYAALIWFILWKGDVFDNLDELGDFLDIPIEKSKMDKAYRRHKMAVAYRAPAYDAK